WLQQALGAVLVLVILLDIFLTVLYARIDTHLISYRLARLTWRFFRLMAKLWRSRKWEVLSFCGPVIVVQFVFVWAFALTAGIALVMHPMLGTAIRSGSGDTPTDFITALYAAGTGMAIVGGSDFMPHTSVARLLYLLDSFIGTSFISVTISYFLQLYSTLQQRNVLGFKIDLLTGGTGDAAELVASLGPGGQFGAGYSSLADLSAEMAGVNEAHHFYPILFYFRFQDVRYSVSRMSLVTLDAVTLIRTALDDGRDGWLKEAAFVRQLWQASMAVLTTLEDAFLPGGAPSASAAPPLDDRTLARWRRRYAAALQVLQQSGIQTVTDEQAGAEAYVLLRSRWDSYVAALVPGMGYDLSEIDPVGVVACESADKAPVAEPA
ncbi:MAG: two pore domain potassium channel family protein, partial [Acetobacteraceae bacterium]|nr:two pore domain potassium channel family protein [Acetobacteraceae bacterium]